MKVKKSLANRRGIYLLPNLLTTAGLFAGFYAVVASMQGHFENAAIAIFIAMIMDGLDGRMARMTNTQSDFGAEYDSMADMVSFGIAPSLVVYNWALTDIGKFGWLASFVYVIGAALRLARFNTQVGTADKRYFQGLASPSAAAILAGLVWLGSEYQWDVRPWGVYVGILTLVTGLLMVSNFRYSSFKEVDWKGKIPFIGVLIIVLVFIFIAMDPPSVLFAGFALYALSGPVMTLWRLKDIKEERRQRKSQEKEVLEPEIVDGQEETEEEASKEDKKD
ncbi:CDP-diacylglycerol--serine O-phosphatidyltransferase [Kangiella shandongensis]|uniref:CDP-diacylglycerol--serine O-phosphatidyltransferase n=1 Tax=Kangiella shandongensis TaxID=2763258 RepID=UPI001CBB203C|nr:CDP-diacylglycerol--serine O-phosphatidyltransferase [Kangiella shandongensis]